MYVYIYISQQHHIYNYTNKQQPIYIYVKKNQVSRFMKAHVYLEQIIHIYIYTINQLYTHYITLSTTIADSTHVYIQDIPSTISRRMTS